MITNKYNGSSLLEDGIDYPLGLGHSLELYGSSEAGSYNQRACNPTVVPVGR